MNICFDIDTFADDKAYDWFMPFNLKFDWSRFFKSEKQCTICGFSEDCYSSIELDRIENDIKEKMNKMNGAKISLYAHGSLVGYIKCKGEDDVKIMKRKKYLIAVFSFDFTPVKHPKGK